MASGGWTSRRNSVPSEFIFNHVPKTGGTSFLAICRDNLTPAEISPHLDDQQIRLMRSSRFEPYRLIRGHISVITQAAFCRNRYTMTLLRDPIRRMVSAYTFWRDSPEYNPVTAKTKELSFAEFVRYFMDSPAVIHNPFTHHYAAIGRDCPSYPASSSALLAAAKNNLAAFDFVGICEHLGRSIRLLCRELGWRPPDAVPHENRSRSESRLDQIDPATMEILEERNQMDLELYRYAAELFEAREADSGAGRECVERNRFLPFPYSHRTERRASIQSVSATWARPETSKILEIAVDFRTNEPISELGLGVQVNDAAGNLVWGVGTAHDGLDLYYEAGRISEAVFIVDCELPRGVYFITVALAEPRRLGFHEHWMDHAASFAVTSPRAAKSRYRRGIAAREFRSHVIRDVNGQ